METSRSTPNYWKAAFAILVILIFLVLILFPVFSRARRASSTTQALNEMKRKGYFYKPADKGVGAGEAEPASWGAVEASSIQRMVISTAEVSLEVSDVRKTHDEIGQIAAQAGGFITESSLSHGEIETGAVTIRVPARQYQPTLQKISKLGKVLHNQQSGQDVTEEFVDLQSRLRNLNRKEQAFLRVLGKANKVSDILLVEEQLGRVRGEIEQATGRIQFLKNQVDLATITVQISEPTPTVTKIVSWDLFVTMKGAANALAVVFRRIASLVIWAVVFIPFWALLGVVIYGSRKYYRRTR